MYGLVHKGLRDYIRSGFGHEVWEKVLARSGLSETHFIPMQSYPDAETYRLVEAATEVLDCPVEKLLESLGRYWVLWVGPETYGELLDMAGESVCELLQNLDVLHTHLANIMLGMNPPSFRCSNIHAHGLHLEYRSSRTGLTPMVIGLIRGIGERFQTPLEVSVLSSKEDEQGACVVFDVRW